MEQIIKYLKTKEGHGIMTALLVVYVSAFSIYLLQQLIISKYPEWYVISWVISSFMVTVMEGFVFFAAVNGYRKMSGVAAIVSVFVLYASTYTLISEQVWQVQTAIIIYTLSPPFLIWFLSERIAEMIKVKVNNEDKKETVKQVPISDLQNTIINYPSLNNGFNSNFKDLKKNA